jgi:serine/threonine protein kinase
MQKRIQFSKVTWPRGPYINQVSNAAKNLIQRLLARTPDARLQGEAVMQHEWFKSIDWDALHARKVCSGPA